MRTVKFENRRAVPRGFRIGVEMDNNVEQVQFELPRIAEGQIETLFWRNGAFADAELLTDGLWTVTNAITRHPGQALCYISISDGSATLWHSETFAAYVCDLPDTEYLLDRTYPSAIQACLEAASQAVAAACAAADAAAGSVADAVRDARMSGNLLQSGRVYQTLRPPHFELWHLNHAMVADNGELVAQPAENWDMYRYAFGKRLVLRVNELVKNSAIQGVLPMAYELSGVCYPLDLNEVGATIVADALLINCMRTTSTVRTGTDGERATLTPEDFDLRYLGYALMAENGQVTMVEAANWNLYRHAFAERTTLRVDQLAKSAGLQGMLPMAYERDSTYYPLNQDEVGQIIEADALMINCLRQPAADAVSEPMQTLTPAQFTLRYAGYVLMAENGQIAAVAAENWDLYRYALPQRTTLRIDEIVKNGQIQGVFPMAYELDNTYYPLDLNEVGNSIVADALLTNYMKSTGQFAMTSVTFTPYAGGSNGDAQQYSIQSFSYTPIENASETTVSTRQYSINSVGFTADERRDFEDVVVCADKLDQFDGIVAFGDSIFYGRSQEGGAVIRQGNGVMQQFAAIMGLPLTILAENEATLSAARQSPKPVVQQVIDWEPQAGTKPLVMIGGGTNDQAAWHLTNLGQYGDDDASTVYGAIKGIINQLLLKGIEPWQIVIVTPIPKGIKGDVKYTAAIDSELTAIGNAMYQTGVAMRCNVINGYRTIFSGLDSWYAKNLMMEDDTHPTEAGATYFAHHIYDALRNRWEKYSDDGTGNITITRRG